LKALELSKRCNVDIKRHFAHRQSGRGNLMGAEHIDIRPKDLLLDCDQEENETNFSAVSVGNYTYGSLTVLAFADHRHLTIGSFCSITSGIVFNLAGDRSTDSISGFPLKAMVLHGQLTEALSKGDIVVDDDVWIGQNAIIPSGVHIG